MDLSDVECTTPWAALQCDFWVTFSRLTARGRFLALGRKSREMRRFSLRDDASSRRSCIRMDGRPRAGTFVSASRVWRMKYDRSDFVEYVARQGPSREATR